MNNVNLTPSQIEIFDIAEIDTTLAHEVITHNEFEIFKGICSHTKKVIFVTDTDSVGDELNFFDSLDAAKSEIEDFLSFNEGYGRDCSSHNLLDDPSEAWSFQNDNDLFYG